MDEPKRKWYRKKRWWAAGAAWLAVVYVAGVGLVGYVDGRGWIDSSWHPTIHVVYAPFFSGGRIRPTVEAPAHWFYELGRAHAKGTQP